MKDLHTLEQAWRTLEPAPRQGRVEALVVRLGNGRHDNPEAVTISVDDGVAGDRWTVGDGDPRAQVSLMEHRIARLVGDDGWTGVGDNLLVDFDLSEPHAPIGTRLAVGTAILEITDKAHLGCGTFRKRFGADALKWVNGVERRARRLRGVHTRVVQGGVVRVGSSIKVI